MAASTTTLALPYPAASDAPDGAGALYALAKRIDDLSTIGTISFPGTVTNVANGSRVARSGYVAQLLCTVALGTGGTPGGGVLLQVNGLTNASQIEGPMSLQDENSTVRGWCHVLLAAGANPQLKFVKAYIDGNAFSNLPQNYRVLGSINFQPA